MASSITGAPYPVSKDLFMVRVGGTVANLSQGATSIIDQVIIPFPFKIRHVYCSYYKTYTNHVDTISLVTNEGTPKTIVAEVADPSADIAGVKQTIHSDVAGVTLAAGTGIRAYADAAGTAEGGTLHYDVWIEPLGG